MESPPTDDARRNVERPLCAGDSPASNDNLRPGSGDTIARSTLEISADIQSRISSSNDTFVQLSSITATSAIGVCSIMTGVDDVLKDFVEYRAEISDTTTDFNIVYQGQSCRWVMKALPVHSVISLRVSIRINDGNTWQHVSTTKFVTACEIILSEIDDITISDSVTIQWSKLLCKSEDETVSYTVELYDAKKKRFIVQNTIDSTTKCCISSLNPYTYYCIRVTSHTNVVVSSAPSVVLTASAATTTATPVLVKKTRDNSTEFSWKSPSTKCISREMADSFSNNQYKLYMSQGAYGEHAIPDRETLTCITTTRRNSFTKDLNAYSWYSFRLDTTYGNRTLAGSVQNTFTGPGPPNPPDSLLVEEVVMPKALSYSGLPNSFIMVQWKSPPPSNGSPITGYALEMSVAKSEYKGVYVGKDHKYTVSMEELQKIGTSVISFRLQAANALGFSPYTIKSIEYTAQPTSATTTSSIKKKKKHTPTKALTTIDSTSNTVATLETWQKSKMQQQQNFLPTVRDATSSYGSSYKASRNLCTDNMQADIERKRYYRPKPNASATTTMRRQLEKLQLYQNS